MPVWRPEILLSAASRRLLIALRRGHFLFAREFRCHPKSLTAASITGAISSASAGYNNEIAYSACSLD
jgi:hypothetical protein